MVNNGQYKNNLYTSQVKLAQRVILKKTAAAILIENSEASTKGAGSV